MTALLHWKAGLCLLIAGLAIFTACRSEPPLFEYRGTVMEPPVPMPDFELRATDGQPFRLSSVQGDVALVYFGYTSCPDVCPLTLADVKNALAPLGNVKNRVHLIFVSVDPERDTPDVLAQYLAGFDDSFIGLSDDFEKVQAVMKPYGVVAEHAHAGESQAEHLVNHTARLYLLDGERRWRLSYPFGFAAQDLTHDLAHLLNLPE